MVLVANDSADIALIADVLSSLLCQGMESLLTESESSSMLNQDLSRGDDDWYPDWGSVGSMISLVISMIEERFASHDD